MPANEHHDTPSEVRRQVRDLVEGFRRNIETLRTPAVHETTVRNEYIDGFWTALGWDVANRLHLGAAQRDVVVEVGLRSHDPTGSSGSKRPDYIFRIGGFSRFVVEAKKPWVDIRTDRDAIFQAKSYAWSAQIPFAVLTNFDRFRLFDATTQPSHSRPEEGLVSDFDIPYSDYVSLIDPIYATFGREAVAAGSLEALLGRIKGVRRGTRIRGIDRLVGDLRGTEPVDKAFLAHLEDFRVRLAKAIFKQNRGAFKDADTSAGRARLTEAAQRIIDRLVFMRVCEDRGIADYGGLRSLVNSCAESGEELDARLSARWRELDIHYNGYLFKPHFSEELRVDGRVLADLVRSLYMPESPYRFEAFSDDLLGVVYERFLGSVIRIVGSDVDAEQKPEVRHKGGVYYTPRFVVDTIVRRCLAPKVEGLAPKDVLNLRVLDPACGSGSFLIAAYQFLVDHCVEEIRKSPDLALVPATPRARKKKKEIAFQDADDTWHLSPDFRSALLTSCLFGVDIDPQAVEVTIMSLYLKMLEEKLPPNWQRQWVEDQLLPALDANIRCGNSLLSPDDLDDWCSAREGTLFEGDDELRYRMNAFDWSSATYGFGRVVEEGGFDSIIGNPPYIRVQELQKWAPDECEFYKWRYKTASKSGYDIYVVFFERSLEFLKKAGLLGFISPHKFWNSTYGEPLRAILSRGKNLSSIVDFTDQQVFHGATTYTAITVVSGRRAKGDIDFARVVELVDGESQCRAIDAGEAPPGVQVFAAAHPKGNAPWHFHDAETRRIIEQASAVGDKQLFPDVCENIYQGIVTGADPIFLTESVEAHPDDSSLALFFSEALDATIPLERGLLVPVVRRDGFTPFWTTATHTLLLTYDRTTGKLIPREILRHEYPRTWEYLEQFEERLRPREGGKFKNTWWCLSGAKNITKWLSPKVMVPYMVNRLCAVYDTEGRAFVNVTTGGYGLELREHDWEDLPHYLVGLLSSSLMDFLLRSFSSHFRGGYYPANKQFIRYLPICVPGDDRQRSLATKIAESARQLVAVQEQLASHSLGSNDRERLARQLDSGRRGIDKRVLELYEIESVPVEVT